MKKVIGITINVAVESPVVCVGREEVLPALNE